MVLFDRLVKVTNATTYRQLDRIVYWSYKYNFAFQLEGFSEWIGAAVDQGKAWPYHGH